MTRFRCRCLAARVAEHEGFPDRLDLLRVFQGPKAQEAFNQRESVFRESSPDETEHRAGGIPGDTAP